MINVILLLCLWHQTSEEKTFELPIKNDNLQFQNNILYSILFNQTSNGEKKFKIGLWFFYNDSV